VQFHEVTHDRQAEPKTAMGAGRAGRALPEAIEGMRQEVGFDTRTGIAHRQRDLVRVRDDTHFDPAAGGRELHGVREEIPDDLPQPVGIGREAKRGVGDRGRYANLFCQRSRPHGVNRGAHDVGRHDRLHVQAQASRHDPGHIQQIVDELLKRRRVPLDRLGRAGSLRVADLAGR
jgi:hypothetical protein